MHWSFGQKSTWHGFWQRDVHSLFPLMITREIQFLSRKMGARRKQFKFRESLERFYLSLNNSISKVKLLEAFRISTETPINLPSIFSLLNTFSFINSVNENDNLFFVSLGKFPIWRILRSVSFCSHHAGCRSRPGDQAALQLFLTAFDYSPFS